MSKSFDWPGRYSRCIAAALAIGAFPGAAAAGAAGQQSAPAPRVTGQARVDRLLNEMTLEQKITMIHGAAEDPRTYQGQAGYLPGIPALGVPALRFADGPPGVLTRIPALAPTATMGVAATFSRKDARANGELIGRLARSHGIDVALQPFINIDRDVTFRRGYNTFGEDPLLTGEIGAAEIEGIQSQGVMAMAKHYIAFDSSGSTDHSAYDVTVEPQALHEIYAAPFADAVRAGVASIMCSYNKVNGKYACGNPDTLTAILRDQIGFKGFVTSDWGAVHATDFINDGLDVEMPGPVKRGSERASYFMDKEGSAAPSNLLKVVQSGAVSEATITKAARRVLLEMDRFGYLNGKTGHTILSPSTEAGEHVSAEDAEVVRKTGEDAAVLLKNASNILPLSSEALRSVALIGPGALQTIAVGQPGEKSVGLPGEEIGPLEALRRLTHTEPNVHLTYAVGDDMSGVPIPAANLSHAGKAGLEREAEGGEPAQTDAQIDFTVRNGHALAANGSYRWSGTLTAPSSGRYEMHMQILGAYGTLMLDGKRVAGNGKMWVHGDVTQAGQNNLLPTTDGLDNVSADTELSAGPHKLTLAVVPDTSGNPVQVRLNWVTPEEQAANYQHALDTAKQAGTVVVFAWAQGDPKFHLPQEQDRLIESIATLNANVIVVLNTSQPVALPWLDHVKGVVEMWWPGDEGGWATANVLLGRTNPAGRLPFTWGRRVEDYPATDPAHPERRGDNPDGKGIFSEGIFVGYRWFDKQNIEPLFPFGFGMSYTHFEYAGLRTRAAADGGVDVSFTIKNAGAVAGDEVPQVYLGPPPHGPEGVQFAVRALAAFDRVHLQPQQSRTITLHVPIRSFQFWSASKGRWVKAQGARTIYVGTSSRDLALETTIR